MNTSSSQGWLRAGLIATVAVSVFLVAGCTGGSKKDARVSGKVTYGGEPLGGGNVILEATGEHAQTFKSIISPQGSYEIAGVPPGEYNVGVETDSIKGMSGGAYGGAKMPGGAKVEQPQLQNMPKYVPIPPKYKDPKTSGLPKITIQAGNKEPKNIDLPKG